MFDIFYLQRGLIFPIWRTKENPMRFIPACPSTELPQTPTTLSSPYPLLMLDIAARAIRPPRSSGPWSSCLAQTAGACASGYLGNRLDEFLGARDFAVARRGLHALADGEGFEDPPSQVLGVVARVLLFGFLECLWRPGVSTMLGW